MNLESEVLQVNIDDIIPNRFQPRLAFDEQGLKELSDSIKEHGIIQPLVLRKLGNKFEIIAGERRYKAATMAGLITVPAVISNIDDNKSAEVALVENVQRRDLTPIEEARSYKSLLDKGYLTQEQLAKKMGLSQPAIANKLRLLNLDEEVQQALMNEKISERHARALLSIDDKAAQKMWLQRIINERLTVRQLDIEIKKEKAEQGLANIPLASSMPNIDEIKNKAEDIIPNKEKRSIESMMVPENIMTEFSGALPADVTPDPQETIPPVNPGFESLSQESQPESRFFNFAAEESVNLDTGINIAPTNESVFQIASNEPPVKNDNPFDQFAEPISQSEYTFNNSPELETLDLTPEVFESTPSINQNSEYLAPTQVQPTKNNIGEAVTTIRNCITTMQNQGIKANIEELDLPEQYQIIVKIDK